MSHLMKAGLLSALHIVVAIAVYWHLITGGWLTSSYRVNDPNIVNLLLAIFEPVAVASVVIYWISKKRFAYRLLVSLGLVQMIIVIGGVTFFILFALFWHPKLM